VFVYYNPVTDIKESNVIETQGYALSQNYPNPFNPATTISYTIPENVFVKLKVYDILGNEVSELVNEHKAKGNHTVNFTDENLASGVYIYTIQVNGFFQSGRMILLK
jgi:hypothetical protein